MWFTTEPPFQMKEPTMKEQPDTYTLEGKIAVMQAALDGKRIQNTALSGEWADVKQPLTWNWNVPSCNYRIHPDDLNPPSEKKWRPWKSEEVPLEAYFKRTFSNICWRACYWELESDSPTVGVNSGSHYTLQDLFNDHQYSLDNGKTWQKCGVLE